MPAENRIDWRPLKWLGKIVLGIILAAGMTLVLEAGLCGNATCTTPGDYLAYWALKGSDVGGIAKLGKSLDIAFNADTAFCFVVLCCLNYVLKWRRNRRDRLSGA